MNSLLLIIAVIIALVGILVFCFCKWKKKSEVKSKSKENLAEREVDILFDDVIDESDFQQKTKMKRETFVVKLEDRSWWKCNSLNFWSWCGVLCSILLIVFLSSIADNKYNVQRDISIRKERQKVLCDSTIQKDEDSIKNEQIEKIFSKVNSINMNVEKIKNIAPRIEKFINIERK